MTVSLVFHYSIQHTATQITDHPSNYFSKILRTTTTAAAAATTTTTHIKKKKKNKEEEKEKREGGALKRGLSFLRG